MILRNEDKYGTMSLSIVGVYKGNRVRKYI